MSKKIVAAAVVLLGIAATVLYVIFGDDFSLSALTDPTPSPTSAPSPNPSAKPADSPEDDEDDAIIVFAPGDSSAPLEDDSEASAKAKDKVRGYDLISLSDERFFANTAVSVGISFDAEKLDGVTSYEIHYTTDGTEPVKTEESLFKDEFVLAAPFKGIAATTLKVKVFYERDGEETSTPTYTHTYFRGKDIETRFDALVFNISTDPCNLYDYEYGIFVEGKLRDDFKQQFPRKNVDPPDPANYNLRGPESERPVFLEVFEPDGTRVIAQGAGIRLSGGWSRAMDQKSLRIFARKEYDEITNLGKFRYEFFENGTTTADFPAVSPLFEFDSIMVRNNANDYGATYIRDELTHTLARKAGLTNASFARPAAVFINGEYYACDWVRQVPDAPRLKQVYNVTEGTFAILGFGENASSMWSSLENGDEADKADFDDILYNTKWTKMADDEVYDAFCERVDIDDLALYYAVQLFIDNRDWPNNNMKVWKYKPEKIDATASQSGDLDGKWRFVVYDLEFSWGLYDNVVTHNTLFRLLNMAGRSGDGESSRMLRMLFQNERFKEKFITVLCDIMGDSFSFESVSEALLELGTAQANELAHAQSELGYPAWAKRDVILNFALKRPDVIYASLEQYLGYSDKYAVSVTGASGLEIRLNSIPINSDREVSVKYFTGHSVTLKVEAENKGVRFRQWLFADGAVSAEREITISAETKVFAIVERFDVSPIIISEIRTSGDDYVKLSNPSPSAVSTAGLYITNDLMKPRKFAIPKATIAANGELTLICKNNKSPESLLNIALPFNLSKGGTLLLIDEDNNVLSVLVVPNAKNGEIVKYNESDGLYHVAAADK